MVGLVAFVSLGARPAGLSPLLFARATVIFAGSYIVYDVQHRTSDVTSYMYLWLAFLAPICGISPRRTLALGPFGCFWLLMWVCGLAGFMLCISHSDGIRRRRRSMLGFSLLGSWRRALEGLLGGIGISN